MFGFHIEDDSEYLRELPWHWSQMSRSDILKICLTACNTFTSLSFSDGDNNNLSDQRYDLGVKVLKLCLQLMTRTPLWCLVFILAHCSIMAHISQRRFAENFYDIGVKCQGQIYLEFVLRLVPRTALSFSDGWDSYSPQLLPTAWSW